MSHTHESVRPRWCFYSVLLLSRALLPFLSPIALPRARKMFTQFFSCFSLPFIVVGVWLCPLPPMCATSHVHVCERVLLRARPFGHRSECVPSSLSRACREGRFFAHPDAVRKVEPPAARDTFTCCSALWLLRCCRRLQNQCGCIVAAAMRCVFSSISAAERATVSTVHLLEWHE